MTVLSEDSDEASRLNHPRKKARLSRHVVSNALDYKVVTSTPVYLNNYMETGETLVSIFFFIEEV
jgi:hypothetical protein